MTASNSDTAAPHLARPNVYPSFTKGLFLGEIREELVFPFPMLSAPERESLDLILESFRKFAAESIHSHQQDVDERFDPAVLKGMAELGMMGVSIPEEYGGFGASSQLFNRVFAEVGATDPALCVYFGAHQSIGIKGIVLFGDDEQKKRWLPRAASGEVVGAFCLTEPGSGSDAQAMKSRATLSDDKSFYTLNGSKIWISNAGYAGVFTVFAQVAVTDDGKTRDRVTAFIVDARTPGIRLGDPEHKMGIRASDTRAVFFENVKVPVAERLGSEGQGFHIALEILNSGRLGLAAGSARGARTILGHAIRYATEREQFGKSIGSFEMIRAKIARLNSEIYAADAAVALTAAMVDHGKIDYSLETAICKVFASELAFRAANDAMQIAGGIGFSREYPYEQALRDSRINQIFEGTNEILRALISLSGLQQPGEHLAEIGQAFKHPLHSLGMISEFLAGKVKRKVVHPEFAMVHPSLKSHAERLASIINDFGQAVESAVIHHGRAIIDRQYVQERLANAVTEIYLSTAVLSRLTHSMEREGGHHDVAAELDCANLFLAASERRAHRSIAALTHNQDSVMDAIAERALAAGGVVPPPPTDD